MAAIGRLLTFLAAITLVLTPTLAAADPGKDESGHGRGASQYEEKHGRGGQTKREWTSGDCKYEYKSGPGGVKEEYKCKDNGKGRGRGRQAGPPDWTPPGHRRSAEPAATQIPDVPIDLAAGRCNRELIGQLLGGAAGAAVGSQIGDGRGRIVAIIGGTVAGVLLGGEVGRTMDRADHLCVDQALEYAPGGQAIAWQDPDGQGQHQVIPEEAYRTESGRYCREYQAQSAVGGETVQTYGTACRHPDGTWEIVSQR